jgi:hypothetical protein
MSNLPIEEIDRFYAQMVRLGGRPHIINRDGSVSYAVEPFTREAVHPMLDDWLRRAGYDDLRDDNQPATSI